MRLKGLFGGFFEGINNYFPNVYVYQFFPYVAGGFKTFEMLFLVLLVVNFLLPRN